MAVRDGFSEGLEASMPASEFDPNIAIDSIRRDHTANSGGAVAPPLD